MNRPTKLTAQYGVQQRCVWLRSPCSTWLCGSCAGLHTAPSTLLVCSWTSPPSPPWCRSSPLCWPSPAPPTTLWSTLLATPVSERPWRSTFPSAACTSLRLLPATTRATPPLRLLRNKHSSAPTIVRPLRSNHSSAPTIDGSYGWTTPSLDVFFLLVFSCKP